MSRKFLLECFDLVGLLAIFLAFSLAGCATAAREELDGQRPRVTRSHPAQYGIGVISVAAAALLGGNAVSESPQTQGK